jgi:hypothetical protein
MPETDRFAILELLAASLNFSARSTMNMPEHGAVGESHFEGA